ncbi:MAG: glycerophosphodiester phosphodiesterase [Dehalococcoidia bacterium]
MSHPQTARLDLVAGRNGPAIIAHGGGNTLEVASQYLQAGADYLEVDIWLRNGQFEARHERRFRWLPFLYEKWYVSRPPRLRYGLPELLAETAGKGAGIFLDLKNGGPASAALLRRIITTNPHPERVVASSQQWRTLRAISEMTPQVDAFYSIDVRAKLDLFLSVADRDDRPRGISCRHSLLSEPVLHHLHERDLLVVAWTVDDLDRARELVSWGVDGLTTHNVEQMRAEFVL